MPHKIKILENIMAMQDNLKQVLDGIINENDTTAKIAFNNYIMEKIINVLKEEKSPFRIDGDDLYVNNKKVGTIKNELEKDGKLHYVSNDGKKKKFNKMADLYAHVGKECGLDESVKDYEKEIQKLDNHGPKLTKVKPFTNDDGQGLDADGDHDGWEDAEQASDKRKKPFKKLIADISNGKRAVKD